MNITTRKIKTITKKNYSGPVYNLGVEEHHNYFANNISVSNCYVSATKNGKNFENVVEKIHDYYGSLDLNLRPFQVAIGGAGEPTMHPDFCEILAAFHSLGIMPNYTTNGMHLTKEIIDATLKHSGGVAVSCHPHIEKIWKKAVKEYVSSGVKTCVHIIVGEEGTADTFWRIYEELEGIHYYVALPYMAAGRAKEIEVEAEWDSFFKEMQGRKVTNVSFGALFYPYFLRNKEMVKDIGISLYEPEVLSGYRLMDDSYKMLRTSSYDLSPKIKNKFELRVVSEE